VKSGPGAGGCREGIRMKYTTTLPYDIKITAFAESKSSSSVRKIS